MFSKQTCNNIGKESNNIEYNKNFEQMENCDLITESLLKTGVATCKRSFALLQSHR